MSRTITVQNEQNHDEAAGKWQGPADDGRSSRALPPAAQRALAEAAERRRKADAQASATPREIGGRGGRDPARYGDWEIKGRAIDF